MIVDIITPDKVVFSGEVKSLKLPGINGSFEILDHHAPLISILGKGDVKLVDTKEKEQLISINGGVVEVKNNVVKVLAE